MSDKKTAISTMLSMNAAALYSVVSTKFQITIPTLSPTPALRIVCLATNPTDAE